MSKEGLSIDKVFEGFEASVVSITLYCLTELPFQLGVKRTIDVLKGNRNAFAQNHGLMSLRTFSALPSFTRDQLSDIFDMLILHGLVDVVMETQEEEEYPVIAINKKGTAFLVGGTYTGLSVLHILMDKDVPGIPDEDQDLFYKLKLTRRQLAEEYDYPAFMVCSDAVLKDICLKKPTEPDELLKISGVDMAFIKHYSKQILYVIRHYMTREKGS